MHETRVHVNNANKLPAPSQRLLREWIQCACTAAEMTVGAVSIGIVDEPTIASLNARFLGRQSSTNVLAFPATMPAASGPHVVAGDIICCPAVIMREATAAGITTTAHWAHMTIHGMLHLLGFDHQTDMQADQMQALEATALDMAGFANPYYITT